MATRSKSSDAPSEKAKGYALAVVNGDIDVCKYVRLACQRFINDLAREDWPYEFRSELADRAINFMQLMPHTKGKWAAKKERLILEPWQCFIEANLFGWVSKETGSRRFREAYEEEPRKNGKSLRLAARGLYLFCADGEAGAEVYSGATTEKQAHEIFRPAWQMAQKLPSLCSRFGIEQAGNSKNPGPMYVINDMSRFEPMIGRPGDGSSPHGALIDEYHEHDTDQMVDAMQTGMGSREQPLLSIITTAGTNLGGPCYEKRKDVIRILEGGAEDETVFGIIYGLDEGIDKWDDPASLKKANPNYNVSVFGDFLLAQLAQARRSATKQNAFRTKHLNEWVGAKTAWMNMLAWQRQKRSLNIDDFVGVPCRMAVDLSSKKDVTAVNLTFQKGDEYYAFWKFFAPESALEENDKYREFMTSGHLEITDGSMIDQEVIENYLVECNEKFDVIDVAFDEWQADYMMVRVAEKKITPIKFPFNVRHISEPMKQLEALVLSGKYFHDGNPMMTWMMGNVAAKIDVRENIFPNKDRPNDPRCKIDGVAVALMSMGRWLIETPAAPEYKVFFVG
jgi:phage terminase large subunit-like protein